MNRFLAACSKQEVDRPPVWIMRQAGRYLPEYRDLRHKAGSFLALCTTPQWAAEATLQPLRRFSLDAAIIFSDILLPLKALGVPLEFTDQGGPKITSPLRSPQQWQSLSPPETWQSLEPVAEAVRLVRRELAPDKALIGFCGAPWTLACYLLEGGHNSDWGQARQAAYAQEEDLAALLRFLGRTMASYLAWQVQAGVQAVQVFDSWAGVLGKKQYAQLVVPALRELGENLASLGVPRILYLGQGSHLLDLVASLPFEVISVDWRTDLQTAARVTGKAVQGNLDPAALLAPPSEVRKLTQHMLASAPRQGYIANLGHGIWPNTPVACVETFVATIQEGT